MKIHLEALKGKKIFSKIEQLKGGFIFPTVLYGIVAGWTIEKVIRAKVCSLECSDHKACKKK